MGRSIIHTALGIRSLSGLEVASHYLPMRKAILHDELAWTRAKPNSAEELLDPYDEISVHHGVFAGPRMIAGVRLVCCDALLDLPSGRFISGLEVNWTGTAFAEISRVMVTPDFRRRGLVAVLIRRALAAAKRRKIGNVVISVPQTPRIEATLSDLGFELLKSDFSYSDSCIVPDVVAACYRIGSDADSRREDYPTQLNFIEQAISEIQ